MKKLYLLEEKYKRKEYNTHYQKYKTIEKQKLWSKYTSNNNNSQNKQKTGIQTHHSNIVLYFSKPK